MAILTNEDLAPTLKPSSKGGPKLKVIEPIQVLRTADAIRNTVIGLALTAYRTESCDVEGLETEVTVVGKIASSRGLTLDPARIVQLATVSTWVSAGRVDVKAVAQAMEKRKIGHHTKLDAEDNISSVLSNHHVAPEVADAILTEAGATRTLLPPKALELVNDPGLDGILADICA